MTYLDARQIMNAVLRGNSWVPLETLTSAIDVSVRTSDELAYMVAMLRKDAMHLQEIAPSTDTAFRVASADSILATLRPGN